MSDGLSELYQELLSGSYDCVDRIAPPISSEGQALYSRAPCDSRA